MSDEEKREELAEEEGIEASSPIDEGTASPEPALGKWRGRMLKALLHESDTEETEEASLRDIVRKMDGKWCMRQMPFVFIVVCFCCVLVTNRYRAQWQLIEQDELRGKLEDITYRADALRSELTEKTRQSMIERRLKSNGDSTLLPSVEQPYVICTDEEEGGKTGE